MQTTNEIVESLARQRVVEGFLERLNEAVEEGFILFLVANIIKNLRKAHSEYSQLITRYQLKAISFNDAHFNDDEE